MHDLNDLYYFAQVVDHGGFAAAARALGMQKSKLSRHIALLEARLGCASSTAHREGSRSPKSGGSSIGAAPPCWWKLMRPSR